MSFDEDTKTMTHSEGEQDESPTPSVEPQSDILPFVYTRTHRHPAFKTSSGYRQHRARVDAFVDAMRRANPELAHVPVPFNAVEHPEAGVYFAAGGQRMHDAKKTFITCARDIDASNSNAAQWGTHPYWVLRLDDEISVKMRFSFFRPAPQTVGPAFPVWIIDDLTQPIFSLLTGVPSTYTSLVFSSPYDLLSFAKYYGRSFPVRLPSRFFNIRTQLDDTIYIPWRSICATGFSRCAPVDDSPSPIPAFDHHVVAVAAPEAVDKTHASETFPEAFRSLAQRLEERTHAYDAMASAYELMTHAYQQASLENHSLKTICCALQREKESLKRKHIEVVDDMSKKLRETRSLHDSLTRDITNALQSDVYNRENQINNE